MNYKIPLFDLNFGEEEAEAVRRTLDSKWISMGPNVASFEQGFAQHLGAHAAVAMSSCTAALHVALLACGVGEGDEVIVPSLTFVATVNAILYTGATPVFADIVGPNDFSIDPNEIDRRATSRTKAVIVMHYGGFSCPMDAIMDIASARNLRVIEDAAHAPDSHWAGRCLGTIGDVGCFSLFSNKNVSCGEGGVLVSQDETIVHRARLLRSHGMTTVSYDRAKGHAMSYDVVALGYNYRMDDIRGAIAIEQLAKLKADTRRRERIRQRYQEAIRGLDIIVPYEEHPYASSNYIFPVVLPSGGRERRGAVRARLAEYGIETSVHYPAVHRFDLYRSFATPLPRTELVSDHELTLPMYQALSDTNVNCIVDALASSLRH